MAKCSTCRRDMLSADGCVGEPFEIDAKTTLTPIRYGDETRYGSDWSRTLLAGKRCHDCNAIIGAFHHPGCDMEECPNCHRQAIGCGCHTKE